MLLGNPQPSCPAAGFPQGLSPRGMVPAGGFAEPLTPPPRAPVGYFGVAAALV